MASLVKIPFAYGIGHRRVVLWTCQGPRLLTAYSGLWKRSYVESNICGPQSNSQKLNYMSRREVVFTPKDWLADIATSHSSIQYVFVW